MKTSAFARVLVRIRIVLVCAALAGIVGLELSVSESLAARIGQTTSRQTESPQDPSVDIADMMAAAR